MDTETKPIEILAEDITPKKFPAVKKNKGANRYAPSKTGALAVFALLVAAIAIIALFQKQTSADFTRPIITVLIIFVWKASAAAIKSYRQRS